MPHKKRKHAEIEAAGEVDGMISEMKKHRRLRGGFDVLVDDVDQLIESKKNVMVEENAFKERLRQYKLTMLEKERKASMLQARMATGEATEEEVKREVSALKGDVGE